MDDQSVLIRVCNGSRLVDVQILDALCQGKSVVVQAINRCAIERLEQALIAVRAQLDQLGLELVSTPQLPQLGSFHERGLPLELKVVGPAPSRERRWTPQTEALTDLDDQPVSALAFRMEWTDTGAGEE